MKATARLCSAAHLFGGIHRAPPSPLYSARKSGHSVMCGEAAENPLFSVVFFATNGPQTRLLCSLPYCLVDILSRRWLCSPNLMSRGWSKWWHLALLQQLSSKSSCLIHRPSPEQAQPTHSGMSIQACPNTSDPHMPEWRSLIYLMRDTIMNAAVTATLWSPT